MDKASFICKIEAILELPPGSLKEETSLADLPAWDSLAVLGFINLVDEDLGRVVDAKSIAGCRTIGDLLAMVGDALQP